MTLHGHFDGNSLGGAPSRVWQLNSETPQCCVLIYDVRNMASHFLARLYRLHLSRATLQTSNTPNDIRLHWTICWNHMKSFQLHEAISESTTWALSHVSYTSVFIATAFAFLSTSHHRWLPYGNVLIWILLLRPRYAERLLFLGHNISACENTILTDM